MSKYPVEVGDMDGVISGVNYLLSGPAGLGQNFSGNSFVSTATFNGNDVEPFTTDGSFLFVSPITISTAEMLDEITFKYTFSSTQSFPPFTNGQPITSQGFVNDIYNQIFYGAGVVECTVNYVIVRSSIPFTVQSSDTSGGTVYFDVMTSLTNTGHIVYTDCIAYATVTGPTDRVFLSSQITADISYTASTSGSFNIGVEIVRRKLINVGDSTNSKIEVDGVDVIPFFSKDVTVTAGTSTEQITAILTSYIDRPDIGFYEYVLGLSFVSIDSSTVIDSVEGSLRTLTTQVVKQ